MSTDRRALWLLAVAALLAGLAAYLLYFDWGHPRLDGGRIDSWSAGPQGTNIREFPVQRGPEQQQFIDDVVALINDAPLTSQRVHPQTGRLLLVLFRDDGLQYHLLQDGDRLVGLAEGDESYVGALDSPALAQVLAQLAPGGAASGGEEG